jgi:hypothetical protein
MTCFFTQLQSLILFDTIKPRYLLYTRGFPVPYIAVRLEGAFLFDQVLILLLLYPQLDCILVKLQVPLDFRVRWSAEAFLVNFFFVAC